LKKRFNKYFPPLFIAGELLVIGLVFLISLYVAFGSFKLSETYLATFLIYMIIWPLLSYFAKDFKIGRAVSYYNTFKKAFTSVFIFISVISITWLFISETLFDRHFTTTLVLLLFVWLTIYRVFVHLILDRYRTFGGNIRNAIIVGYDNLGFNLFDLIKKKPHYGIRCDGVFGVGEIPELNDNYPFKGLIDDFDFIDMASVDFIYMSGHLDKKYRDAVIRLGDQHAKKVKLLPELKTDALKTFVLKRYESIPVVDINNLPLDNIFNQSLKRLFDIIFSMVMVLCFLSWMYPIFGLLIKIGSRGPVFFRQEREGKDGIWFACLKFRTMRLNENSDTEWASEDDPRITYFGRFLRRTSLDEFPQFLNVLMGQMSIVGPRPHPVSLNKEYKNKVEKFAKRHESRPGVTGLAQAMGYRGEISEFHDMNSRVKLDRFYLQNWSFFLDIKIVFLTAFGIMKGQDKAY